MAASQVGNWTVFVTVEEDDSLTGVYQMSPNTKLSEMLQKWKDDFELFGHWGFLSESEETTFYEDSMTLAAIGETKRRRIILSAALIDEPTNEIFVHLKEKFHHLSVKPNDKLYEVQWRIQEKPKFFEYNGLPLNVMHTIQEAGLKNKSVIQEPLRSVAVTLSSGYTKLFEIPVDGMVLNLRNKVSIHETSDFSLKYQGRYLKSDESVRPLTQVVEVTTAQFVVNFHDQRVSWITKEEPITVSDFICQLAANANIDTKKLESVQLVCVGCQRRIHQSESFVQRLPIECCKEKSLTLDVVSPSDSGTNWNGATKNIEALHDILIQYRMKGSTTETCRSVVRGIEGNFQEARLDYNTVVRCSDVLLKRINELEETIKEMKAEKERMIQEKERMVQEKERLVDEMEERLGVKLLLRYDPDDFSPASCPEVTSQGQWPFDPSVSFVKCRVPGIRPGSTPFEEVVAVLQPLLRRGKIRRISQCLGSVAGRTVTMATSRDGDEVMKMKESPYCGVDGAEHSWEEAGEPGWPFIGRRGSVFVCGGGRRTFMQISWF